MPLVQEMRNLPTFYILRILDVICLCVYMYIYLCERRHACAQHACGGPQCPHSTLLETGTLAPAIYVRIPGPYASEGFFYPCLSFHRNADITVLSHAWLYIDLGIST